MEVTTGKVYTKRELDSDKTSIVNFVVAVYDITPAQRQEGRGRAVCRGHSVTQLGPRKKCI